MPRPHTRPLALALLASLLCGCALNNQPPATATLPPAEPTFVATASTDKGLTPTVPPTPSATAAPSPTASPTATPTPSPTAAPTAAPTTAATVVPTLTAAPTVLPTSTAGPTLLPTDTPVPAAPTLVPPLGTSLPSTGLVGPEWTIASLGDLNFDGRQDVVAYKPATVVPRQARPDLPFVASEIVVVQQGLLGPELQLAINGREVVVPGLQLAQFQDGAGPAAFQLQVGNSALALIPLNAAGDIPMLGAALVWDASAVGYRLAALSGAPAPTAPGPPLVGAEWLVAQQGDLNANGRRDTLAYKPGPAVALQGGYSVSISALVIVEEGPLGRAELQLLLDQQQLSVPGLTLAAYPAQIRPSGFQAALGQGGVVASFAPFDASGRVFTRGARIVWDGSAQGYRPTADSEIVPAPRALLGPEWTIAAEGDANGDGRRDLIAFKPAGLQVNPPNPNYRLVVSEIVVVQESASGPYGTPEVQLAINTREVVAPGVQLFTYASPDPRRAVGAFLLNVSSSSVAPLAFVPVNTAGSPLGDLAAVAAWSAAAQGYRMQLGTAPPQPTPQQTPQPTPGSALLGPEWSILAQGDFNGDGRRDAIGYKRSAVVARTADAALPVVASELVIVQEGAGGQPELQLAITPGQVVVPGRVLVSYPTPPAGFLIGVVAGRGGALTFTPLNASGEVIGQRSTLAWNPAQLLYLP